MRKILVLMGIFLVLAILPTTGKTGCLVARGEGKAVLQGSGEIILKGNGVLVVEDLGRQDAKIYTDGNGRVEKFGNVSIYKGNGYARVTGKNLVVEIKTYMGASGFACGKGLHIVFGEGAFKSWAP